MPELAYRTSKGANDSTVASLDKGWIPKPQKDLLEEIRKLPNKNLESFKKDREKTYNSKKREEKSRNRQNNAEEASLNSRR